MAILSPGLCKYRPKQLQPHTLQSTPLLFCASPSCASLEATAQRLCAFLGDAERDLQPHTVQGALQGQGPFQGQGAEAVGAAMSGAAVALSVLTRLNTEFVASRYSSM